MASSGVENIPPSPRTNVRALSFPFLEAEKGGHFSLSFFPTLAERVWSGPYCVKAFSPKTNQREELHLDVSEDVSLKDED